MEWAIGIITLMAVMAAIISGGMGVRLMYIDTEYGRLIRSARDAHDASARGGKDEPVPKPEASGQSDVDTRRRLLEARKALLDLYTKREFNRRGVPFDGACVIVILVDGFVTALGISPSLLISTALAFMVFGNALVLLQYHVRTILRLSQ